MKHNLKFKLSLKTQTVRMLDADKLAVAAGGLLNASNHEPPSCPLMHSCGLICFK
jgi:hypothetical protein